ncbi:outer membrane lipid asymmetry maintenance protein MlaD [Methyloglobulus sp.]|uniref:outer membrane lipid asymmetry maintenance protein MlaD n=1 Tax=Methyloglobulus sp. TaxID=2518622 RepID=UPI003988F7E5
MQHSSTQDTLVGLFVASGIAGLFFLALQVSNLSSFTEQAGYTVTARFENSGGLKVKSPVSAAGVKIGQVSDISFDPKTYESVVKMRINSQYSSIPEDTTASILTAGLLGEQYVSLEPGGSGEYLKEGGKIEITQSAIILEKAIGQFLFKSAEEKK